MESKFTPEETGIADRGVSAAEKGLNEATDGTSVARLSPEAAKEHNSLALLREYQAGHSKAAFQECYQQRHDISAFCDCLIEKAKDKQTWFYLRCGNEQDFRTFGRCIREGENLFRPSDVDRARVILLLHGLREDVDYLDKIWLDRCWRQHSPISSSEPAPYINDLCQPVSIGNGEADKARELILMPAEPIAVAAGCTPSPGARYSLRQGIAHPQREAYLGNVFSSSSAGKISFTVFGEQMLRSQKTGGFIDPKTVDINEYFSLLLAWDTAYLYGTMWDIQLLMLKEGIPDPVYTAAYDWVTAQAGEENGNAMYRWYPPLRTYFFTADMLCKAGSWTDRVFSL